MSRNFSSFSFLEGEVLKFPIEELEYSFDEEDQIACYGDVSRRDKIFLLRNLLKEGQYIDLDSEYVETMWQKGLYSDQKIWADGDGAYPIELSKDEFLHLPFEKFLVGYTDYTNRYYGLDPQELYVEEGKEKAHALTGLYAIERRENGIDCYRLEIRVGPPETHFEEKSPGWWQYTRFEGGKKYHDEMDILAWWRLKALSWSLLDLVEHRLNKPMKFPTSVDTKTRVKFCYVNSVLKMKVPRVIYKSVATGLTEIIFSHRFAVIGHWRKIRGYGKDARGEKISGRTWVASYIKGPEGAPLKKQTRHISLDANLQGELNA